MRYSWLDQDTPTQFQLTQIEGIIIFQFVNCNMKVFKERGGGRLRTERKDTVETTKPRSGLYEGQEVDGLIRAGERLISTKAKWSKRLIGVVHLRGFWPALTLKADRHQGESFK